MKQFNTLFDKLKALISDNTPAIAVCGISGLGKTYLIRSVCRELNVAAWIDYDFALNSSSFKENLRYGLIKAISCFDIENLVVSKYLNIEEEICFYISIIEKENQLILSFENIEDAKDTDIAFITKLLEMNGNFYNFCIIIEEDTDAKVNNNFSKLASCAIFKTINIERYLEADIKNFICNRTKCLEIEVADNDLKHICETAQGSLSVTNMIINDLLSRNYAEICDRKLIIRKLPDNFLIDGVKQYVLNRFESLNGEYKSLLAKTSCIGMTFDIDDTYTIFSIARTYDILQTIQDVSHLILRIEDNEFKFESKEAYSFIHRNISDYCDRTAVIKMCADYYRFTLNERLKSTDYKKYLRNLTLAKELYSAINNIPSTLACYENLIGNKINLGLYREARELCNEYSNLCKDERLNYFNKVQILLCLIETEEYAEAIAVINELKKMSGRLCDYLDYYSALAYYGISDGKRALNILLKNIECPDIKTNALLYAKELRLISSIYDFYDDWENQLYYFNLAIKTCIDNKLEHEYYSLLRQSGMVYIPEIALKHYEESENYFSENGEIKELAKVRHNIATDSMYMLDFGKSRIKCLDSISGFKSIGSQCVANSLNQMGILLCVVDKNYEEAKKYFIHSEKLNDDKFMKCTAYLNASTASSCLCEEEEYKKYMNLAKQLNNGEMPIITATEKICELLYCFRTGNAKSCESIIGECLEIKKYLEYRHILVIKHVAKSLFLNKQYYFFEKDNIITNFINSQCEDYIEKCLEDNCYWATTRFWEN